jgi:hypothetical protein
MELATSYAQMPANEGGSYSDSTCAGAVFNTVEAAYRASDYVATRGAQLNEPGAHFKHYVDEGSVSFDTRQRAPVTTDGVTAAVVDKEAGDRYTCAHGVTAKSNVVIDVSACSYGMADQGVAVVSSIVNAIAGKFPA